MRSARLLARANPYLVPSISLGIGVFVALYTFVLGIYSGGHYLISAVFLAIGVYTLLLARKYCLHKEENAIVRSLVDGRELDDQVIIINLYKQYKLFSNSARRSFVFSIIILIISIAFVMFAEQISGTLIQSNSIERINSLLPLVDDRVFMPRKREDVLNSFYVMSEEIAFYKEALASSLNSDERKAYQKLIEDVLREKQKAILVYDQKKIDISEKLTEIEIAKSNWLNNTIMIFIYKVSVLAVAMFMIYLFFGAYRRNLLVAAAYHSRMLAVIAVGSSDVEKITKCIAVYTTEHYEVKTDASNPVDYLSGLVDKLIGIVSRK